MAVEVEVVPAQAKHVRSIARRMRKADADEVMAGSGKTPVQALTYSLRKSRRAWVALIDGEPEVMFGVCDGNVLAGVGVAWLLGTDAIDRHYVAFLRGSKHWLSQLLALYPVLRNLVDDRNRVSKRWLRWLGAKVSEPMQLRGHNWRLFELRRNDV